MFRAKEKYDIEKIDKEYELYENENELYENELYENEYEVYEPKSKTYECKNSLFDLEYESELNIEETDRQDKLTDDLLEFLNIGPNISFSELENGPTLREQVTIEEIDKQYKPNKPRFGFLNFLFKSKPAPSEPEDEEWLELKKKIKDGDELWEFDNFDAIRRPLCGCAGICIVRNGKIIDRIITIVS